MLKGPLYISIFTSLWFGILSLPFTGILKALFISGSIFILLLLWHFLKSAFSLKPSIGLRISIPFKPSTITFSAIGLIIFLPFIVSSYIIDTLVLAGIYIILSLGLNIMIGYTGLLNLGYAAFYAIGAYTYAIFNTKLHLGFWEALPISMFLSGLAGFLLGIPALRLRGDYLAIVTLGFGEITRIVLNNWISLTNGPNGITGIERPSLAGYELSGVIEYYYTVLIFVILTIFFIKRLIKSKAGRAWMSIREDEVAATAMGINTFLYKLYAFSFGALWAGLAGQLFAAKMRFVSPESFTFFESVMIVAMVILGGQGTIAGPVIGSIILVLLPEVLREFQQYRMIFLGAGLIFMMIFRPQGIVGKRIS